MTASRTAVFRRVVRLCGCWCVSKAHRLIANPAACCARHARSIELTSTDDPPRGTSRSRLARSGSDWDGAAWS